MKTTRRRFPGTAATSLVTMIVPHGDPSVSLDDATHCLRGDRVEVVWAVTARGMSQ